MNRQFIFADSDFEFYKVIQTISGVDCTRYTVINGERAHTYCVEIKLKSEYNPTPCNEVYEEVYIAHGMNISRHEKLNDTIEYIDVLQKAVEFAKRVEKYLIDEGLLIG